MTWKGFKDFRGTIEIDLSKSVEGLWNSIDKDARWGIIKANNSGLEVRPSREWELFYEIYKLTCYYGNIIPIKLDEVKEGRLFGCYLDNELIASAVVKFNGNVVTLFLNASKKEYLKFQPNNLLYWTMIKELKEEGLKIFDLGGFQFKAQKGSKLYGVNRFKSRWGGEIVKQPLYFKNPFQVLGRKIIRNIHVIKRFRDNMKFKKYWDGGWANED